jgi:isoleucyl-tRNA synthetase
MKEKGWTKQKVGRLPFRQEAARYAEHFVNVQKQEFKRLGVVGDWEHPYKTLAPDYEAGIAQTFFDLLDNGCVYRDKKPVYWCATCETALAEAEVEYEEKTSPSIYVKFPVLEWPNNEEAQKFAKAAGKRVFVLVWTTTPWTLPANVALAFHPEQTYLLWESPHSSEKFLVGEPGWKVLDQALGEGKKDGPTISGLSLEGLLAKNPLNNNGSQGILAEFVSREEGTGVVHIAPGHGQEDYVVGREYGLPVLSPVNESGRFTNDVLPNALAGKNIWEANPLVVEALNKSRLLLKEEKITHSYPHCWRCKNPILFRATEQWFLKVDPDFRRKLLESVDRVRWTPEYGKERIAGMLKTRPDWCLSRQRYWGVPIPMFFCEGCRHPLQDKTVFSRVVDLFRQRGSDVWFEKDAKDLLPSGVKCVKCGKGEFRKEEDILDVWFDSGVSWVSVLRNRMNVKDRRNVMYLEGSDQHRGWFQTSLLPAVALTGEPPYEQVLTHGFVVDGEGRKMSKSLGNVIAPQEILEKYGADILRLWVSMSDYREDVRLSQDILNRVIDTYRKLRNTLRFLLGNLWDFDPAQHAVPAEKMEALDLAALDALNKATGQVKRHYDLYEFHMVSSVLCGDFCVNTLSEYYLDVLKDALYCDEPDSARRRSAQTAFLFIAKALARMLAPLLSFTAEETWQTLKESRLLNDQEDPDSVFLNGFPQPFPLPAGRQFSMADFLRAKGKINEGIERARQSGAVKAANDAHVVLVLPQTQKLFDGLSPAAFASCMGVSKITFLPTTNGESLSVQQVEKAPGAKCLRCWIWREDVGDEGVCRRCLDAEKTLALAKEAR